MAEIPTAAISRLVTYLRILEQLETQDVSRTSSSDLAERAGGDLGLKDVFPDSLIGIGHF